MKLRPDLWMLMALLACEDSGEVLATGLGSSPVNPTDTQDSGDTDLPQACVGRVADTEPRPGDDDVLPGRALQVWFEEAVEPPRLTFSLRSGSTSWGGEAAWSEDNTRAMFTPNRAMAAGAPFTLRVDGPCGREEVDFQTSSPAWRLRFDGAEQISPSVSDFDFRTVLGTSVMGVTEAGAGRVGLILGVSEGTGQDRCAPTASTQSAVDLADGEASGVRLASPGGFRVEGTVVVAPRIELDLAYDVEAGRLSDVEVFAVLPCAGLEAAVGEDVCGQIAGPPLPCPGQGVGTCVRVRWAKVGVDPAPGLEVVEVSPSAAAACP